MSNALTQPITKTAIEQAIAEAYTKVQYGTRWGNALDKAVEYLKEARWIFYGDVLVMYSTNPKTPNAKYYVKTDSCSCPAGAAGKPCKHRAARRLLKNALSVQTC